MLPRAENPHEILAELCKRLGLPDEEREGYHRRLGEALLLRALEESFLDEVADAIERPRRLGVDGPTGFGGER